MSIIWFTENYPPNKGGMSRSCDRIISNLRKHHTVHIYHFTNKQKAFKTVANVRGSYTSIPVFEDSSHSLNVLWAHLKENKQIINCDSLVAYGCHLSLKGMPIISKWLQKPLLTCIRGNDFDNAIFSQKKQDLLYSIRNSAAIACVTKEKVERIKNMQINKNVYFTPNSIDFSEWKILNSDKLLAKKYKQEIETNTNCIIGLIGYLKQKKGIDFFIDNLQKSKLINKIHLRIVGEIEMHIEDKLIKNNIHYSKATPNSKTELIANYLICDAVAIPSIYDGMPNVIFEAASLNIPLIASRAGGIPDILNSENAFLFDVLSEYSCIKAISHFYESDKKDLIEKSKNLKTKIKEEFNSKIETQNYLNIFEKIS